jgi:SMI1/KNR4 family protein SUKH-1
MSTSLIDQFVTTLNRGDLGVLPTSEVPEDLRLGAPDADDCCKWQIRAIESAPWIVDLEGKLPVPLPPSFREFVTTYRFAEFEADPIMFFANTGEPVHHELAEAVFRDRIMSKHLLDEGFVQFGREAGGGYDPVCFDTNSMGWDGEYAVVRIDHEDMLTNGKVTVRQKLAESFADFVQQYLVRVGTTV